MGSVAWSLSRAGGGGRLTTTKCAGKRSLNGSLAGLITFIQGSFVGKYFKVFTGCVSLCSAHLFKNSGHCLSQLEYFLEGSLHILVL